MAAYATRDELDAIETRVGTLEQEMARVSADIADTDRWFAHQDKRMDRQDSRLDWLLGLLVLLLITALGALIYVVAA